MTIHPLRETACTHGCRIMLKKFSGTSHVVVAVRHTPRTRRSSSPEAMTAPDAPPETVSESRATWLDQKFTLEMHVGKTIAPWEMFCLESKTCSQRQRTNDQCYYYATMFLSVGSTSCTVQFGHIWNATVTITMKRRQKCNCTLLCFSWKKQTLLYLASFGRVRKMIETCETARLHGATISLAYCSRRWGQNARNACGKAKENSSFATKPHVRINQEAIVV